MSEWLQKQWGKKGLWFVLLMPLSWLFAMLTTARRLFYRIGLLGTHRFDVPVIVVGNINVGGTGKTPFVIWLAESLRDAGYKPGIISRGYGGKARQVEHVSPESEAELVGDEPVLLAARTRCPVFVSPDRIAAGKALLAKFPQCNILISDDGLQHYRLQRDMEIVIYDAKKAFGNGALLPAGPLRESISRLRSVDFVVCNGELSTAQICGVQVSQMQLESDSFYNLLSPQHQAGPSFFKDKKILAVAGIGNPQRFFDKLSSIGLAFEAKACPDHYQYQSADFSDVTADIILMTEKDAVKCKSFATFAFWVLPVSAAVQDGLLEAMLEHLKPVTLKH